MLRKLIVALTFVSLLTACASAQSGYGVMGIWREPGGSVLDVHSCGTNVCVKLIALSPNAPTTLDGNNPNPAQRSRSLCGLQVGWGFHLSDPDHGADGYIYDPRSGRSYHGSLTSEGDHLQLRGWAGFKIFGRTETWTRLEHAPPACAS